VVTDITAILVVGFDTATCSNCGGGAELDALAHDQNLPHSTSKSKPCGAKFDRFAMTSAVLSRINAFMRRRPDLDYFGVGVVEGQGNNARFVEAII
jgi:hypothetical protein